MLSIYLLIFCGVAAEPPMPGTSLSIEPTCEPQAGTAFLGKGRVGWQPGREFGLIYKNSPAERGVNASCMPMHRQQNVPVNAGMQGLGVYERTPCLHVTPARNRSKQHRDVPAVAHVEDTQCHSGYAWTWMPNYKDLARKYPMRASLATSTARTIGTPSAPAGGVT